MKIYTGTRTEDANAVQVDDLPLAATIESRLCITDPYDWGNSSPGARRLAHDLLNSALESWNLAGEVWEAFTNEVVVKLGYGGWTLTQFGIWTWVLGELEGRMRKAIQRHPSCIIV